MHQSADGHVPSVIDLTEYVFHGNANVTEKNLVEFALAGHLAQRTDFNAGRFHVDQQNRETLVFGNSRICAYHQLAPDSYPTVTRPHLLDVDDIMFVRKPRLSLQSGEIGARIWFGEALAPNFFGAENLRNEALLLSVCTVSDDRRPDEPQAQGVRHRRGFEKRHFLPKNRLLHQGGAAATVFFWPRNGCPAAFMKFPLPGSQVGKGFFQWLFPPFAPILWNVDLQPLAKFVAKGHLFGGEVQVHFFLAPWFTNDAGLLGLRYALRRATGGRAL